MSPDVAFSHLNHSKTAAPARTEDKVLSDSPDQPAGSWFSRFLRWLDSDAAKRYPVPGLVAYYQAGGSPKACSVANISASGMYLFTEERWLKGSVIPMTLQLGDGGGSDGENWIAVLSRVVRWGSDGCGLTFVFSGSTTLFAQEVPPERLANPKTLKRFLRHLNS